MSRTTQSVLIISDQRRERGGRAEMELCLKLIHIFSELSCSNSEAQTHPGSVSQYEVRYIISIAYVKITASIVIVHFVKSSPFVSTSSFLTSLLS